MGVQLDGHRMKMKQWKLWKSETGSVWICVSVMRAWIFICDEELSTVATPN